MEKPLKSHDDFIECFRCHGDGGWYIRTGADDQWDSETCDLCYGTGDIPKDDRNSLSEP